jgi:beta-lactam-binding protein with PASTA domain
VLGIAAAVLILGFLTFFAVGGGGSPSASGGFPTTTTTLPMSGTTSTSIVTLKGLTGPKKRYVIVQVAVPNVVGMTLAQAGSTLSSVGLGYGVSDGSAQPSGTSSTGTVVAQTPAAGAQAFRDDVIQLTVSGY